MSDKKPYDTSIARMAGNIAAGIIGCVEPSRVTEAEREQTVDLAVDLAQRIVRRLTAAHVDTSAARDEFIAGVTDDLGFAEWSSAEGGERVLRALIDKWYPRGRWLLKESR